MYTVLNKRFPLREPAHGWPWPRGAPAPGQCGPVLALLVLLLSLLLVVVVVVVLLFVSSSRHTTTTTTTTTTTIIAIIVIMFVFSGRLSGGRAGRPASRPLGPPSCR